MNFIQFAIAAWPLTLMILVVIGMLIWSGSTSGEPKAENADYGSYESRRVYPLRRGRQTGPAETPGDGWVEFRGDNGASLLFHVSVEFTDRSDFDQKHFWREPRSRTIPPQEILAARFRLADGSEGSFADLFREIISRWPASFANHLHGKELGDNAETGAEMVINPKLYETMRERSDRFANRSFCVSAHCTYRRMDYHVREVGNVPVPQLTELVA